MAFALLTRTIPAGAPVFINPNNVVAVDTFNSFTRVYVTAADKDGNLITINVAEPMQNVVQRLSAAQAT